MEPEDRPHHLPEGVDFPTSHAWPVALRAGGVVLRPLRWYDRAQWHRIRTRSRSWLHDWEATPPPGCDPAPPTFLGLLRAQRVQARSGTILPWAIAWDPEGDLSDARAPVVGQVSLAGISYGSARSATVGYWIDVEHAGLGITPTAVALACDYAFSVMRLHRIEICICPENDKSLRVVDKLGFRSEGRRPAFLHINGTWRDHDVFALHEDEATDGLLVRLEQAGRIAG